MHNSQQAVRGVLWLRLEDRLTTTQLTSDGRRKLNKHDLSTKVTVRNQPAVHKEKT